MKIRFPAGRLLAAFLTLVLALLLSAEESSPPVRFPLRAADGVLIHHPLDLGVRRVPVGGTPVEVPSNFVAVPGGPCVLGQGRESIRSNLPTFLVGRFPVTEAEYHAFAEATGLRQRPRHWIRGRFPVGRELHPVPNVSLPDAERYCAWVSANTGRKVRLPTAAEWEKAARGPDGRLHPWGDEVGVRFRDGRIESRFNYNGVLAARILAEQPDLPARYTKAGPPYRDRITTVGQVAAYRSDGTATPFSVSPSGNVSGWIEHSTRTGFVNTDVFSALNATGGGTSPVGTYPGGASVYGAQDMAGNLWAWTSTRITAKTGAEKGKTVNEIRGGSWYATARSCRSVGIGEGREPSGRYNTVGFRVVIEP